MATREADRAPSERLSFDDLLSPCETYEGSRHYAAFGDEGVDVADADTETGKTVIMSPALLAELRREVRAQQLRDPPHTRPTQRALRATRPEGSEPTYVNEATVTCPPRGDELDRRAG